MGSFKRTKAVYFIAIPFLLTKTLWIMRFNEVSTDFHPNKCALVELARRFRFNAVFFPFQWFSIQRNFSPFFNWNVNNQGITFERIFQFQIGMEPLVFENYAEKWILTRVNFSHENGAMHVRRLLIIRCLLTYLVHFHEDTVHFSFEPPNSRLVLQINFTSIKIIERWNWHTNWFIGCNGPQANKNHALDAECGIS